MKFFLFVIITISIWYVMRWMQQAEVTRRERQQRMGGQQGAGSPRARKAVQATDMTRCVRCGTYVPVTVSSACGRTDCPLPGRR